MIAVAITAYDPDADTDRRVAAAGAHTIDAVAELALQSRPASA